jgi:hypothetical protein
MGAMPMTVTADEIVHAFQHQFPLQYDLVVARMIAEKQTQQIQELEQEISILRTKDEEV